VAAEIEVNVEYLIALEKRRRICNSILE